MRTKFLTSACTILSAALVLFSGCKKIDSAQKMTFKGYLMKSCDSAMPRHTMWIDYYSKDMAGTVNKQNIGSDTSREDGYFEIICPREGNGNYNIIVDGNKKFTYDGSGPLGDVVDLGKIIWGDGTIQSTVLSQGLIRFHISNPSPSDTLFVGYGNFSKTAIYPVSNQNYYPISISVVTSELPYNQNAPLTWGRGLNDYLVAADSFASNSSKYHKINGKLNICGYIDTTVVEVP